MTKYELRQRQLEIEDTNRGDEKYLQDTKLDYDEQIWSDADLMDRLEDIQ